MLFGNYYALFKLVRDYIVFWRFFVVDGNKEQRSKDWLYSTNLLIEVQVAKAYMDFELLLKFIYMKNE